MEFSPLVAVLNKGPRGLAGQCPSPEPRRGSLGGASCPCSRGPSVHTATALCGPPSRSVTWGGRLPQPQAATPTASQLCDPSGICAEGVASSQLHRGGRGGGDEGLHLGGGGPRPQAGFTQERPETPPPKHVSLAPALGPGHAARSPRRSISPGQVFPLTESPRVSCPRGARAWGVGLTHPRPLVPRGAACCSAFQHNLLCTVGPHGEPQTGALGGTA